MGASIWMTAATAVGITLGADGRFMIDPLSGYRKSFFPHYQAGGH